MFCLINSSYIKSIHPVILVMALFCQALICSSQPVVNSYLDNSSGDMLLMYYGGKYRKNWTKEQLKPIVTHQFSDGHTDWFFPSYLYLEFRRDQYLFGNEQPGGTTGAKKEDWEWLLNRLFQEGQGLDALDKCISECKKTLGPPPFRHKVVLVIPSPRNDQRDWGKINGKSLDFRKSKDKLKAVQWYVDEILKRFHSQGYINISLDGLYWVDETASHCSDILGDVGNYVRKSGTKFYWIPFSTAYGRFDWKSYNVDCCYLQTGFFWNMSQSENQLRQLCAQAKKYGLGLEFELSRHLMSEQKKYYPRLMKLMDIYEEQGVFDSCGLTYYLDNSAIIDLYESKNMDLVKFLDRLANHIARRNQKNATILNAPSNNSPSNTSTPASNQPTLDWRNPEYWHF